MVNNNFALNTIFSETDPNKIANVVVTEICNIIEYLAPSKKPNAVSHIAPGLIRILRYRLVFVTIFIP